MAWFFADDEITTEYYTISGEDAAHISRSLRMRAGEELTLCTPDGRRHDCVIDEVTKDSVRVRVLRSTVCEQEPELKVSLYVALMKGDKIDDVVQKAVELGVYEITPFISARLPMTFTPESVWKAGARFMAPPLLEALLPLKATEPNSTFMLA